MGRRAFGYDCASRPAPARLLGGIVGGWVFGLLGIWPGGGMIGSIIVAFVGAVILVWISLLLKKA